LEFIRKGREHGVSLLNHNVPEKEWHDALIGVGRMTLFIRMNITLMWFSFPSLNALFGLRTESNIRVT